MELEFVAIILIAMVFLAMWHCFAVNIGKIKCKRRLHVNRTHIIPAQIVNLVQAQTTTLPVTANVNEIRFTAVNVII